MVVKKLREIYSVDTISQDKGWKKINEAVSTIDDDITIDFSGINVVEPWQCAEFRTLLENPKVHMIFSNMESMVKRIQMMCIIEGLDENRIVNKYVEVPKEKTSDEKKIEYNGKELAEKYFKVDTENNVVTFNVNDKYSQIHSTNTLNYVEFAIRKISEETGIKKFIIILGTISIQNNVLEFLANMIVNFKIEGLELLVDADNEETCKNLGLFVHIANNSKYNSSARYEIIRKSIKEGTPGILIKYKKSKAVDEFGRHGKGEVVSSRIAIFRGFKPGNKTITTQRTLPDGTVRVVNEIPYVMLVDTYNNNLFYTKQHWMVEHDNEEPRKLMPEKVEIGMEEVGFADEFLGSKYHFIFPVQDKPEESQVVIKDLDDEGKNIKQLCTIPERMKIVFDDWGIKYDVESLDRAIENTKEHLKNTAQN